LVEDVPSGQNLSLDEKFRHPHVPWYPTELIYFTSSLSSVALQEAPFSQLAPAMWVNINCAVDMASFSYQCLHHFPEPVVFS